MVYHIGKDKLEIFTYFENRVIYILKIMLKHLHACCIF